jgi:hypothetical protein
MISSKKQSKLEEVEKEAELKQPLDYVEIKDPPAYTELMRELDEHERMLGDE